MPPRLKRFIQSWIINTFAVLIAVYVVPGIHYENPLDLLIASLLLGILNAFLRPVILLLALPIVVFTLGLFSLVINALLLYFVGFVLRPYFFVDSFAAAFWGALIISIVSVILNALTGGKGWHIECRRRPRPPDSDRGGDGPVIDI